jgi:hypothetical protein
MSIVLFSRGECNDLLLIGCCLNDAVNERFLRFGSENGFCFDEEGFVWFLEGTLL